ncbi:hypothetical protein RHMOL_Rhmol05G0122400 [Rhododendron molle]|uniref:Uncharacterized protein n=1 Tax=Rhododendron molle TaxID=49168 RepID=A0ACC0NPF1_RHOML|nr:hypothetical protein RHMOL_Rhmol05G0122400 [Rhododendron molle]
MPSLKLYCGYLSNNKCLQYPSSSFCYLHWDDNSSRVIHPNLNRPNSDFCDLERLKTAAPPGFLSVLTSTCPWHLYDCNQRSERGVRRGILATRLPFFGHTMPYDESAERRSATTTLRVIQLMEEEVQISRGIMIYSFMMLYVSHRVARSLGQSYWVNVGKPQQYQLGIVGSEVSEITEYDLLDMLSGSMDRVHKAIKAFFVTPQNNFCVFLNGSLIYAALGGGGDSISHIIGKEDVLRLNPDVDKQNMLLVGMSDKKIVQWDMNTGQITQEYDQHLGVVNTITFVDDNRRFITSSDDKSLRNWGFVCNVANRLLCGLLISRARQIC